MVTQHYSYLAFVFLNKQLLPCSFEEGSNMSLTQGKTIGMVGICDTCVIGVDLAIGVTILVVPGRVFT